MRATSIVIGLLLIGPQARLRAQEAPKPEPATAVKPVSPHAEDEKALAALLAAFTKAFNAGDAAAVAATFAEDALVVDEEGTRTEGRAAIQEQLAANFADSPGSKIEIKVESQRFLSADTALEEGETVITLASGGTPEISRFTVVYTKQGGKWLQSAVRDEAVKELTAHDHLKELEWLVGEWVNESLDAIVHTTCKWTDDGNFLVRDFTMKTKGRPVLSGTQRIGWDPTRRQFKTWIFDSEGGFGDGYWARNGDEWVITAEGVRQDGTNASATNTIKRLGKDRASWKSENRIVGGAAVPGVDEFTIVRKPPEPAR